MASLVLFSGLAACGDRDGGGEKKAKRETPNERMVAACAGLFDEYARVADAGRYSRSEERRRAQDLCDCVGEEIGEDLDADALRAVAKAMNETRNKIRDLSAGDHSELSDIGDDMDQDLRVELSSADYQLFEQAPRRCANRLEDRYARPQKKG